MFKKIKKNDNFRIAKSPSPVFVYEESTFKISGESNHGHFRKIFRIPKRH